MLTNIEFSVAGCTTRQQLREKVVSVFLLEVPGEGTGDLASCYNYYVENLADGRRIFLTRPEWPYYPLDFVVRVEDTDFGSEGYPRNNPKHADILEDLRAKRSQTPGRYRELYGLVERVFRCEDVPVEEVNLVKFDYGHPADLILMVLKWMFIEQDIAYWNYSGRHKLMSAIPKPDL